MACEKCSKFNGHSTTHYRAFIDVFAVVKSSGASMAENGNARCKYCGQLIAFDYDETLIPKLRIEFLADIPDNNY